MVTLVKRRPLSRQHFLALRQRILRKDAPPGNSLIMVPWWCITRVLTIEEATPNKDVEVKQSPPCDAEEDKDDNITSSAEPSAQEEEENSQLLREQEEKRKKLREERSEISRQVQCMFAPISC